MPRLRNALTALPLAITVLTAEPSLGASYRGKNVDDRRYHVDILNNDFGAYNGLEVKFQGDHAFVYFRSGGRLVLILDDENIVDPHAITAHDPRRGITWELDVKDMGR